MKEKHACILLALIAAPLTINAQWAIYRDPATPRTKAGKPNLSAPAPHMNGRPDLSGIWQAESAPIGEIRQCLLPGDITGLGEDLPSKYFFTFWLGYSVGKWMGDSFVVETVGFNDKSPLDAIGHPHSESMRLRESFRRRDFGHLDASITINDPKTYAKPVTIRVAFRLGPDTELLEAFCSEDEKDLAHFPGK